MSNSERKTKGRQKVPMVRMEKQSNRLVTFSKRRLGLFKKASELCTLCGAKVAIVVFSPGRKAFSFGHPSVDAIINRFMSGSHKRGGQQRPDKALEENDVTLSNLNEELSLLNNQIEVERKHTEELLKERKARDESWWLTPIDEIWPSNLQEYMGTMTELREQLLQLGQKMVEESTDENGEPFMGLTNPMDPSREPFLLSLGEGGGQEGLVGDQPPLLMVSNPTERNHSEHRPMVMIPTPMVVPQHPSLAMGSNGSMSNLMGGFDTPNVPAFGGGGQFDGPYNMAMIPMTMPSNFGSFTSLLMGNSPTGASNSAYNPHGGFGFGPGYY